MDKLKHEIHRIKRHRLEYYHSHLDLVEGYIDEKPDISIETCKALIEGISKLSLHLLNQEPLNGLVKQDRNGGNKSEPFQTVFKRALQELQKGRGFSDAALCNRFGTAIQYIGELRNDHGDIGHGRASLKEQVNDADFAELIIGITDNICTYMLRRLDTLAEPVLEYEDNPEFNEYLDDQHALPGKVRYSHALFNQEFETYEILLSDYNLELNPDDE
ncbi:abortive infection family protein [Ruegeria sp. 2012CJ41-6]|uniref:Abortive infection family protein n=1 Tax=Ruegeria spongiae TaxID=2942209 RepID=A0ABT0Q3A2_9RHOB|nr:abortive infection family protein [Ruegeria spongiae]MCL6284272.1 abortive infection family protein [Ruegeria spongiae]